MNDSIHIAINGDSFEATGGETVLDVARRNGIEIPTLCHDPRLDSASACRMCLVEISGQRRLQPACSWQVATDMDITTESPRIDKHRRMLLALYNSDHPLDGDLPVETGNGNELRRLAMEYHPPSLEPIASPRNGRSSDANPFIAYDPDLCILCARCTRYCDEVEGVSAISLSFRGSETTISTAASQGLLDTTCELCGGCIDTCPTGAMHEKKAPMDLTPDDVTKVRTTCSYCGVGCQMDLNVNEGRVVRVTSPPPGTTVNDGNLCVKGRFAYDFIHDPDRLTQPLVRRDGELVPTTWDDAIRAAAEGLARVGQEHGPNSLFFVSSARCTGEENYLVQKLARTAGGTNNCHQCSATCHAPTVAGLVTSVGTGAMTNSIDEIRDADMLFVIGANATEAHPIIGMEMKRAVRHGARLFVADPRSIWLTGVAVQHLQLRPGTDVWLINAMVNVVISEELYDHEYVENHSEGFYDLRRSVSQYSLEEAEVVTGVPANIIRDTAVAYATTRKAGVYYTLGITEHTHGTDNVTALANLVAITGHFGVKSAGMNPLRGQNNVQGANDAGASPIYLPGYQSVTDDEIRDRFARAWDAPVSSEPGMNLNELMPALAEGKVRGLFIMGENIVISEPDTAMVEEALNKCEFFVSQEIFMTETTQFADVVLPGACFAEKDGVFTNSDRRVQRVRKAVEPPGEARADWEILCDLARAMGYPMPDYSDPAEIYEEMTSLAPQFAGITYERLESDAGVQWPCPDPNHPGTPMLHVGNPIRGKALLQPVEYRPSAELTDAEYPFVLSTGRTLYQYNSATMTRRDAFESKREARNFVELHSRDARKLHVKDGETVRILSRRGSVDVMAQISRRVRPGCVWMPMHFAEGRANLVTNPAGDSKTGTPEYKVCAVAVEKITTHDTANRTAETVTEG
jgi:formate dehydrogenase (NADP+) alpha subunit